MRTVRLILTTVLLGACTSVHYESPRLSERQASRDTVAVLPVEMLFTGKAPRGLSTAQILAIEEGESLAFQHALYGQLLDRSSIRRQRPILVRVQPIAETNRLLAAHGITLRQGWELPPQDLARVLGVDAVIETRIQKTRYLSDLASWSTEVGLEVLLDVTDGKAVPFVPPGLTRTHDIWADCVLVGADDGDTLWKVSVHRATDWRQPANDVVVGITRKLSKKFPYRG